MVVYYMCSFQLKTYSFKSSRFETLLLLSGSLFLDVISKCLFSCQDVQWFVFHREILPLEDISMFQLKIYAFESSKYRLHIPQPIKMLIKERKGIAKCEVRFPENAVLYFCDVLCRRLFTSAISNPILYQGKNVYI